MYSIETIIALNSEPSPERAAREAYAQVQSSEYRETKAWARRRALARKHGVELTADKRARHIKATREY